MIDKRGAILAVAGVLTLCVAGAVVVAMFGSAGPAGPSRPSASPSDARTTDFASFQLQETFVDTGDSIVSTGFVLTVGQSGGPTATYGVSYPAPLEEPLNLVGIPSVAGARDDTVVVAFFDGAASWLQAVDVATGKARPATQVDGVVAAAATDWSKSVSYVARHDLDSLASLGIWRVGIDGAAEPLVPPDRTFDARVMDGERTWLDLTPDGAMLLRWVCRGDACRLDGIDTATGQRRFRTGGLGYGVLLGTGNRIAIATAMPPEVERACVSQAQGTLLPFCPFAMIDLQTGRIHLGEARCDDVIVVAQRDPLVVVAAAMAPDCGADQYGLIAHDIERGRSTPVNPATDGFELVPDLRDQGTTLDGAFVVAPEGMFPFGSQRGKAEVVAVPP